MGLLDLPSTAANSLGADLTTKPGTTDGGESWRLRASLLNNIRNYLIALGQAVGLGDGSTPNSLEARANPPHLRSMPSVGFMPPVSFVEHFAAGNVLAPPFAQAVSGGTVTSTASPAGRVGLAQCQRGTTAANRAGITTTSSVFVALGAGRARFRSDVRTTQLSTGTDRFTLYSGLGDSNVGDPVDGVFFRYVDSTNGGRWQCVTRSSNVETVVDSGVTVVAGAWYALELEVNAAGTLATFWINGTQVGTSSTNIPTGSGRETGVIALNLVGSLGTTSVSADVDYCAFRFDPTVPL